MERERERERERGEREGRKRGGERERERPANRIVLGWETAWELRVPLAFFKLIYFSKII